MRASQFLILAGKARAILQGRYNVSCEDVRAIAGVLGVRYRVLADGEFNHTGVLVLLDADGRIVARSSKTGGAVDPLFMDRIRAALAV